MRILLFIGSLQTGGAERQMSLIAKGLAARNHNIVIMTLFPGGRFWDELRSDHSIKLMSLYSSRPTLSIFVLGCLLWAPWRLHRFLFDRELVYSALSITDFIAWLATRFSGHCQLVWSIRAGSVPEYWKLRWPFELCRLVSASIPLVITNSCEGRSFLLQAGFSGNRLIIIQNGIDTDYFRYNAAGREQIRAEWQLDDKIKVIGLIGRLTQEKGYEVFLDAAVRVRNQQPNVHFIAVGGGSAVYQRQLDNLVNKLDLADCLSWVGRRDDMPNIYSALDVCCSASNTEGFPNVLAEAMSCGRSCVATDVGDADDILGGHGWIVPPDDPSALADVLLAAIINPDNGSAKVARRQHIESRFNIGRMLSETERELSDILPKVK